MQFFQVMASDYLLQHFLEGYIYVFLYSRVCRNLSCKVGMFFFPLFKIHFKSL